MILDEVQQGTEAVPYLTIGNETIGKTTCILVRFKWLF